MSVKNSLKLPVPVNDSDVRELVENSKVSRNVACGDGLYLQVKSSSRAYFSWRHSIGGKRVEKVIGKFPDLGIADARNRIHQLKVQQEGFKSLELEKKKSIRATRSLRNEVPRSLISIEKVKRFWECIGKSELPDLYKNVIKYLLLIPYPSSSLINVTWNDFKPEYGMLNCRSNSKAKHLIHSPLVTIRLPRTALQILQAMNSENRDHYGNLLLERSEFIFSEALANHVEGPSRFRLLTIRDINTAIKRIPGYKDVDVRIFPALFQYIALKSGLFSSGFVKNSFNFRVRMASRKDPIQIEDEKLMLLSWWDKSIIRNWYSSIGIY